MGPWTLPCIHLSVFYVFGHNQPQERMGFPSRAMLVCQQSPVLVHQQVCVPTVPLAMSLGPLWHHWQLGGGRWHRLGWWSAVQIQTCYIKADKEWSENPLFFSWTLTQFSANCLTKIKAFDTKTAMNNISGFLDSLEMEACWNSVLLLLMLY